MVWGERKRIVNQKMLCEFVLIYAVTEILNRAQPHVSLFARWSFRFLWIGKPDQKGRASNQIEAKG